MFVLALVAAGEDQDAMMSRYDAKGIEAEFEPGSRGRVLRNRCGISGVRTMQFAESRALEAVEEVLLTRFAAGHRFTEDDVRLIHRLWLGGIYQWAGEYRNVNIAKDGFMFAAAQQVPRLMGEFEVRFLRPLTPCADMGEATLVAALARTHAELVIIHPFREGNGRCARLLAWLMALQAGLPPLDFSPFQGRGKHHYIAAIHAAFSGNYESMETMFSRVVQRTLRAYVQEPVR